MVTDYGSATFFLFYFAFYFVGVNGDGLMAEPVTHPNLSWICRVGERKFFAQFLAVAQPGGLIPTRTKVSSSILVHTLCIPMHH